MKRNYMLLLLCLAFLIASGNGIKRAYAGNSGKEKPSNSSSSSTPPSSKVVDNDDQDQNQDDENQDEDQSVSYHDDDEDNQELSHGSISDSFVVGELKEGEVNETRGFEQAFREQFITKAFEIEKGRKAILKDEFKSIIDRHLKIEMGMFNSRNMDISALNLQKELQKLQKRTIDIVLEKYKERYGDHEEKISENMTDRYRDQQITFRQDFMDEFNIVWLEIVNQPVHFEDHEISMMTYLIKNAEIADSLVNKVTILLQYGVSRNADIKGFLQAPRSSSKTDIPIYALVIRLSPLFSDEYSQFPYVVEKSTRVDPKTQKNVEQCSRPEDEKSLTMMNLRRRAILALTNNEITFDKFPETLDEVETKTARERLMAMDYNNDISVTFNTVENGEKLSSQILTEIAKQNDYESYVAFIDRVEEAGCDILKYDKSAKQEAYQRQIDSPHAEFILKDLFSSHQPLLAKIKGSHKIENLNLVEIFFEKQSEVSMLWKDKAPELRYDEDFAQSVFVRMRESLMEKLLDKVASQSRDTHYTKEDLAINLENFAKSLRYRDRILIHLNRWSMVLGDQNEGNEGDGKLIKMLRYFGRGTTIDKTVKANLSLGEERVRDVFFKGANVQYTEYLTNQGMNIALRTRNTYNWTPFHYFVATNGADKLAMALNFAEDVGVHFGLDEVDGKRDNLFHAALLQATYSSATGKEVLNSENRHLNLLDDKQARSLLDRTGIEGLFSSDKQTQITNSIGALLAIASNGREQEAIRALNQPNYLGYTPVSQAIATANYGAFELMKDWLIERNAWTETRHMTGSMDIWSLMRESLRKFEEVCSDKDALTEQRKEQIVRLANAIKDEIANREKYGLKTIQKEGRKKPKKAEKRMIHAINKTLLAQAEADATDRGEGKGMYQSALDDGFKYIKPIQAEGKGLKGMVASLLGLKNVSMNNLMAHATPTIQKTWITPGLDIVMDRYRAPLAKKEQKRSWKKTYEKITGSATFDYFNKLFGSDKIEELIQEYMKEKLSDVIENDELKRGKKDDWTNVIEYNQNDESEKQKVELAQKQIKARHQAPRAGTKTVGNEPKKKSLFVKKNSATSTSSKPESAVQ